jgi:hypothetical protein
VIVADAVAPATTVPIDSVFAGPAGPALPATPAPPCGPTPPAIDTDELELATVADTLPPDTVAEIGCDVVVTLMSVIC